MRNFNIDQLDTRTVSLVAAAGVAGLALIGLGSMLLRGSPTLREEDPELATWVETYWAKFVKTTDE
jgi:hypothetical protein